MSINGFPLSDTMIPELSATHENTIPEGMGVVVWKEKNKNKSLKKMNLQLLFFESSRNPS